MKPLRQSELLGSFLLRDAPTQSMVHENQLLQLWAFVVEGQLDIGRGLQLELG